MSKIKKLWKALSGAVSWNLKEPKITDRFLRQLKKDQQKNADNADINKELV
ncbi:MAG: hypothetical protein JO080_02280 [Mucilaginibacter sp.]|nr:hypothetical protein [Mucilaginibacter sp.]